MRSTSFFLDLTMAKKKKKNKEKKNKKVAKVFQGDVINDIHAVTSVYNSRLEETYSQFDLSNEQYRILQILKDAPAEGFSLKQIREALPNQTSNATRLVDKLHSKKLLIKKSSREDKRLLNITLSQQGGSVLSETQSKIAGINKQVTSALSGKEGKSLQKSLEKLSLSLNLL